METIKQLIAKNDIAAALRQLEAQVSPNLANDVTQLSARFKGVEREKRLGLISYSEAAIERARIVDAILDLAKAAGPDRPPPGPQPSPSPPAAGKKKVLFICSSPDGKNPLDFGDAFREIEQARQRADRRDQFEEVDIKTGVLRRELLRILVKAEPDVLHISLHSSKSQGLYFKDRAGRVAPINAEDFAGTISDYCKRPEGKDKIEVIILAACNSLKHGEAVLPYADYVVCTQDFYPDEAGIVYAEEFYSHYFEGERVDFCHTAAVRVIKQEGYEKPEGNTYPVHEIPILIPK